jgi:ABC-type Mn2+/Zn2+ transport system permease subunit
MLDLIGWLTEPYQYEFMQRALVAALIVGCVTPAVGVWVVLRRLSYVGDAMAHSTLGGVAIAYLAGISVIFGALGAGLLMALLLAVLAFNPRLKEDSTIGIAETTLFALGVLLISTRRDVAVDLQHFLFGSIATVTTNDILINLGLGSLVILTIGVFFGDLRMASYDPIQARLVGIRVTGLRHLLMILIAITVVISLQTVGLLMTIAILIVPSAAARLITDTTLNMTLTAVGFGLFSAVLGLTASYHLASSPGATIAVVSVVILAICFIVTAPRRTRIPVGHLPERPTRPPEGWQSG